MKRKFVLWILLSSIGGGLLAFLFLWKGTFNMERRILSSNFEVQLSDTLREDKACSDQLVAILSEAHEKYKINTRNEYLSSAESTKTWREFIKALIQFASKYPDTTSALTAKLLCAKRIQYCMDTSEENENSLRKQRELALEIINQHPHTWQASLATVDVALVAGYSGQKKDEIEAIRIMENYLKEDFVDIPFDNPEYISCLGWIYDIKETSFKPRMLLLLLYWQEGVAYGHMDSKIATEIDQEWVEKARKTKQELLSRYPNSEAAKEAREKIDI
jgi:(2Fe-2S) ferredoxin